MPRMVHKFSVVYVSTGDKTEVFRSVEAIPQDVRRHIARTARSSQVETLVIANEKGRELLQSQGWNRPDGPRSSLPSLSPLLRWSIVGLLTAAVGLIVTWMIHFR